MKKINGMLVVLTVVLLCSQCIWANDAIRSIWMKGYVIMEAADKARTENNELEAAQLYRDALDIFVTVQRRNPQWNPALLNYRITYCRQAIQQLTEVAPGKAESMTKNQLVEANQAHVETIAKLTEERRALNSKVEILNDALSRARSEAAKAAGAEASLKTLVAERKAAEEKNMLLELKLKEAEAVNERLKTNASHKKELDEAKVQLDKSRILLRETSDELSRTQKESDNLLKQNDLLKRTNAKLQQDKTDLDLALKVVREVSSARKQEIDSLQNKQEGLQKRYEELEKVIVERDREIQKLTERNRSLSNKRKKGGSKSESQVSKLEEELNSLREAAEKNRVQILLGREELVTVKGELENTRKKLALAEEQSIKLADQMTSRSQGLDVRKSEDQLMREQLVDVTRKYEESQKQIANLEHRLDAQVNLTREQESSLKDLPRLQKQSVENLRTIERQKKQIDRLAAEVNVLDQTLATAKANRSAKEDAVEMSLMHQREKDKLQSRVALLEAEMKSLREVKSQDDAEVANRVDNVYRALDEELKKLGLPAETETRLRESLGGMAELARKALAGDAESTKQLQEARHKLIAFQERLDEADASLAESKNSLAKSEAARSEASEALALATDDVKTQRVKQSAADGMSKELAERSEELKDANLKLNAAMQKIIVLETQLKEADAGTGITTTGAGANQQIEELKHRLRQEQAKRKALEIALADQKPVPAEDPTALPGITPQATAKNDDPDMIQERRRREREKEAVLKGFLRQAIDAEKQDKIEAAQWNYAKVLELSPDHPIALQRLGIIASNQGNDLDTIKYLRQAFRADPDDPDTLFALGYALIRQSEHDWAVSMMARAVALNPKNADMAKTYGMALATLGWTQPAEKQLIKAHDLNPKDPEPPFSLAILMATSKPARIDDARKWYEIALKNGAQNDPGLDAVLKPNQAGK